MVAVPRRRACPHRPGPRRQGDPDVVDAWALGLANYTAYCPSKAAIDLLTKTLGVEWGPHRINVNAIAPTVFRSELTGWMYADSGNGPVVRENMLRRIPLGRLGEPTDFHGAVLCLASSASDFMTGSIVYLDGGYTAG